jgi:uncharacterized membrane protein YphA (DoxX/SURF4 family)
VDRKTLYQILKILIALVWITNGLFCKLLDLVPRHQQIVGRILGGQHAALFTKFIGTAEVLMAVWVLSNIKPRFNAIVQMAIIAVMNTIEFIMAPDLLLWGRMNAFFAFLFIMFIYYNEFKLNPAGIKK